MTTDLLPQKTKIALRQRGMSEPDWWITTVLGADLWEKQREVIRSLSIHREVATRSCHGAGKTYLAARAALAFLYTHKPSIVITTAPTDRQVRGQLWREMRSAHHRSRMYLGEKRPLTQQLELDDDWFAIGFTAPDQDPDRFQGWHGEWVLVIVDESSGVSPAINDAINSLLSGQNTRRLDIGNPTDPSSQFARRFKTPGIHKIAISAYDTPNFTTFGITEESIADGSWEDLIGGEALPYPSLITPQWVSDRYHRDGPDSPIYISRVKADFPSAGPNTLIDLAWIEAAEKRRLRPTGERELGADLAEMGDDRSICYLRDGGVFRLRFSTNKEELMQTAGRLVIQRRETGAVRVKVDDIGYGAGVRSRLRELEEPVVSVDVRRSPRHPDKFERLRDELLWGLRERFRLGEVDLDPGDEEHEELKEELSTVKYEFTSSGKTKVESTDKIKERLKRSPDRMMALAIAAYNPGITWKADDVDFGPQPNVLEDSPWSGVAEETADTWEDSPW